MMVFCKSFEVISLVCRNLRNEVKISIDLCSYNYDHVSILTIYKKLCNDECVTLIID